MHHDGLTVGDGAQVGRIGVSTGDFGGLAAEERSVAMRNHSEIHQSKTP